MTVESELQRSNQPALNCAISSEVWTDRPQGATTNE